MRKKIVNHKAAADVLVKDIHRQIRKRHSTEEKIRLVLAGLRGDDKQHPPAECYGAMENDHSI